MTNAQRQAEFRKRHPEYNRRYKARIRAQLAALKAARTPAPVSIPALVPVLQTKFLLPAPVVVPIIPGMNTIEAIRIKQPALLQPPVQLARPPRPAPPAPRPALSLEAR